MRGGAKTACTGEGATGRRSLNERRFSVITRPGDRM
jgi:hypothetical protein